MKISNHSFTVHVNLPSDFYYRMLQKNTPLPFGSQIQVTVTISLRAELLGFHVLTCKNILFLYECVSVCVFQCKREANIRSCLQGP